MIITKNEMAMNQYFNVNLEFDKERADQIICDTIVSGGKGYVCLIESNNLTVANKNSAFGEVVNHSLVNVCDGSNVAWLLGKIHHKPFTSYIGNDLFLKYIRMKRYKHYFLGNTKYVLDELRSTLSLIDPEIATMCFEELPFRAIDEFDYKAIADGINSVFPDIVWVSLGAPKQEFFMARLLPYLKRGVMFGVGAAFNFNAKNATNVRRAPQWMLNCRMEWIYRAFNEPRKNVPRYWNFIKILPSLFLHEYKAKNMSS